MMTRVMTKKVLSENIIALASIVEMFRLLLP